MLRTHPAHSILLNAGIMGKASKALQAFINGIPDAKLTGISQSPGTIYHDTDFRLDMQGVSTPSHLSSQSAIEML